MNTFKSTLALAALMCTSSLAFANNDGDQHRRHGHDRMMSSRMESMDTNKDGLISKDEFMKAHEAMWDTMPKNANGAVSLADMKSAHQEHMKEQNECRHDQMMEGHEKMRKEREREADKSMSPTNPAN